MSIRSARVRAQYSVLRDTPEMIWIVDLDRGAMSVTNDADAVVDEVVAIYGDKRIVYRDSDGHWDELRHMHGAFLSFEPAGAFAPKAKP